MYFVVIQFNRIFMTGHRKLHTLGSAMNLILVLHIYFLPLTSSFAPYIKAYKELLDERTKIH